MVGTTQLLAAEVLLRLPRACPLRLA